MDFSVEYTVTDEGIVVLVISGPMDVATVPQLRDLMVRLIDEGHHRLVLDLAGVDFIDSIGLGVIVGVVHRLRPHGGAIAVAAPSEQVRQVLQITQLARVVALYDATAEAVSAVLEGNAVVPASQRPDRQASDG